MSVWTAVYDRLDDGLNPILVKELRQAVKSRVIIAILFFFLIIQLMIVTIGILDSSGDLSQWSSGKRVFLSQQIVLYFTILVALPAYCGSRMLAERTDPSGDFMFLTALSPVSIVLGKLFASLAIGLLVFSVCAPFMTMAYLLRGIDLITIFSVLGIDLVLMGLAMQFALFAAALPGDLVLKRLASAAGFLGLLFFGFVTNRGFWFAIELGSSNWLWLLPTLVPLFGFFGYFLVYSIAMIGSASSNGMVFVRIYLFFFMLSTWALLASAAWMWPTGMGGPGFLPPEQFPAMFADSFVMIFCLQLFVSTCEKDRIGARIARTIPKWPLFRRLAFVFYSGSAGGILFSLLSIVLIMALALLLNSRIGSGTAYSAAQITRLIVLILYSYFYAMLGFLFRILFFQDRTKTHLTWIVSAIFLGVLSIGPNILSYLANPGIQNPADLMIWNLTNPFYFFFSYSFRMASNGEGANEFIFFLAAWAVALTGLAASEFMKQFTSFQPLEEQPLRKGP